MVPKVKGTIMVDEERERETERQRERQRQTDRDRQTDRQTDRKKVCRPTGVGDCWQPY